MSSPLSEFCLMILALEVIIGLYSNGFIIFSFTCSDLKGTSAAPYNNILVALNVFNMGYTFLMAVSLLISQFFQSILFTQISIIFYYLSLFCIISSSWLTADLCFFYLIKILQFQSRFLTWMKMKIDRMIPFLVFSGIITSVLESVIIVCIFNPDSHNSSSPFTGGFEIFREKKMTFMNVVLTVTSPPFLIAILTTTASAVFLKLHSFHMKVNIGNSNVKYYQSAVQTMACLIAYYALIYIVLIVIALQLFTDGSWGNWICAMVIFSFSMVQSGLLIRGNPKLKEAWRKMFTFSKLLHTSN